MKTLTLCVSDNQETAYVTPNFLLNSNDSNPYRRVCVYVCVCVCLCV